VIQQDGLGDAANYASFQADSVGDLVIYASGGDTLLSGNFLPSQTNAYDLGSATYYWQDLYLEGSTIYFDDSTDAQIKYETAGGYFSFDPDGNSIGNVFFTDSGKVGIGTSRHCSTRTQEGVGTI